MRLSCVCTPRDSRDYKSVSVCVYDVLLGFRPVMAVILLTLLRSAPSTLDRRRGSSAPQVSKGPTEVRQAGTCGRRLECAACTGGHAWGWGVGETVTELTEQGAWSRPRAG